jgi:hypothetical protein
MIENLIYSAGNKTFSVIEDVYKCDLIVKCDKKPMDSLVYNIKWEEV